MDWQTVAHDTYYSGRRMEAEARTAAEPGKWLEYAALKVRKGSYALGIHGYLNAANLCEARGDTSGAAAAYGQGLDVAMRAGYRELALILTYRLAQLRESAGDWEECIATYERLGAFCEGQQAFFMAADAYEHVAEIMRKAGRDTSGYTKPIELWERNVRYWEEKGAEDDAAWSRQHIALYRQLFGVGA